MEAFLIWQPSARALDVREAAPPEQPVGSEGDPFRPLRFVSHQVCKEGRAAPLRGDFCAARRLPERARRAGSVDVGSVARHDRPEVARFVQPLLGQGELADNLPHAG